jgi:carbon starvation protein CstA
MNIRLATGLYMAAFLPVLAVWVLLAPRQPLLGVVAVSGYVIGLFLLRCRACGFSTWRTEDKPAFGVQRNSPIPNRHCARCGLDFRTNGFGKRPKL